MKNLTNEKITQEKKIKMLALLKGKNGMRMIKQINLLSV